MGAIIRIAEHVAEGKPPEDETEEKKESVDEKLVRINPAFKYLGFALLLVYHYTLWFVPDSFFNTQLLSNQVTYAWVANLAATAVSMLIATACLGRERHLSSHKALNVILPILLIITTLALEYLPAFFPDHLPITPLAVIAGVLEGLIWILWGEYLTRTRAKFSVAHIGSVFGGLLLFCMIVGMLLPSGITPVFNCLLLAASSYLLLVSDRNAECPFPQLLPKRTVQKVLLNIGIVCFIAFFASTACYFLVAIVPWEGLPFRQSSFSFGIIAGSVALLLASLLFVLLKGRVSVFSMFPYLLVLSIVGLSLFLTDLHYNFAAFLIALCVSSLLEVSLIMYFGTLTQRGYFPPAMSFSMSVIPVRLGICTGNGLALFYESQSLVTANADCTALIFVCILATLLVPMSKRESVIVSLTSTPASPAEIDVVCQQIIDEFGLSEREGEILCLIARNNTANAIATKLVISPYTVNTHIRHIYEKVHIHKRGELLEYINKRQNDA